MPLINWDAPTLVFVAMIFALLLFTYGGVGMGENPFIVGAAMLTAPVTQFMNSISSGSFLGADLVWVLPLFFIFTLAYFGFLQNFLGEGVVALVLIATAIVILSGFGV